MKVIPMAQQLQVLPLKINKTSIPRDGDSFASSINSMNIIKSRKLYLTENVG
jgi:hypothetical protein